MSSKGYDWTELSFKLGIKGYGSTKRELFLEKTKDYMLRYIFDEDGQAHIIIAIKEFLTELHDKCKAKGDHSTLLWERILEIEHGFTMIKYTVILLEYMHIE